MPANEVDDVPLREYERRLVDLLPALDRCRTPWPPSLDDVDVISCQLSAGHAPTVRHWHWSDGIDVTWPWSPADG
jgi:hypothetical protein